MASLHYWAIGVICIASACKPKENTISSPLERKYNFVEKSVIEYLDTFARHSVKFHPSSTELTDSITFVENIDFLMEYHKEESDLMKNQIKHLDNQELVNVHLPEASNTMRDINTEYLYLKSLRDSFEHISPAEIAAYLYLQKGTIVEEDGSTYEKDYWVHVDKNKKVLNISTKEMHNLDLHIIEFDEPDF